MEEDESHYFILAKICQAISDLRIRVRDQEDAAHATQINNDILRQQVEEQRKQFEEMVELEMQKQKRVFEEKVFLFFFC